MFVVYSDRSRLGFQRRRGIAAGISSQLSGPVTRTRYVFRRAKSVLAETTCLDDELPSLIGVEIH